MKESNSISLKQYRILLSFSLLLIFTTSTVPAFLIALVQTILFCLLNLLIFEKIRNKRICWGIFLSISVLFGEGYFFLSEYLPEAFSSSGFFLLPASTFLFLSAPMFHYITDERKLTFGDIGKGLFFFSPVGLIISLIREAFGNASICGTHIKSLEKLSLRFFGHTAGSALLVLCVLILLVLYKNSETEKDWVLDTSEKKNRIYQPISASGEKKFVTLCIGMLIYDLLFGGIGVAILLNTPQSLQKPSHIVLLSSVTSLILLTLIVKFFHLSETMDMYFYIPLLSVITTSVPMIFYTQYLSLPSKTDSPFRIIWWIALMVGVWLFTAAVVAYARSINGRLLFGKQPKCLEGIPLIVLHILLAMVVFMPWTQVMANL